MKKLLVLFCGAMIFCACASQYQNIQTANSNEPNLTELKAQCEKNNAKSCSDLGYIILDVSQSGGKRKR